MGYDDLCTWTCSRGYCPDVCSSNFGCVSGSGDGGYAGLCNFSCGREFCPEPCTCLANGTVATPQSLPGYAGDAIGSVDEKTFGPLCNFTCAHDYCPPTACAEKINLDITNADVTRSNPSISGLTPFSMADAAFIRGDTLTYTAAPPNSDLSLDFVLVNGPTQFTDATCAGVDQGILGCIAEAVEWMTYAMYTDGGPVETTPIRRSLNSSLHQGLNVLLPYFQYHTKWHLAENCTTIRCMLISGTPSHTWTPLGNGSYNGTFQDLHFIHAGNLIGHRAWPGGIPDDLSGEKTLTERQYRHGIPSGQLLGSKPIYIDYYTSKDQRNGYNNFYSDDAMGALDTSRIIAEAVEHVVADTSYTEFCGSMLASGAIVEDGALWNIVANGTDQDLPIPQAEADLRSCSQAAAPVDLVCVYNLYADDSSLVDPTPPFKFRFKREYLEPLSEEEKKRHLSELEPRAAGPSGGNAEDYPIYEAPANPNGPTNAFNFHTPTYPAGDNGDALDQETGQS